MYCWNCGHKNADGNKFCGECGKVLLNPETQAAGKSPESEQIPAPRGEGKRIPGILEKTTPASQKNASQKSDSQKSESTKTASQPPSPESPAGKTEPVVRPADAPDVPRTSAKGKLTNPLVEEPRVVRETLTPQPQSPTPHSAVPPSPVPQHRPVGTPMFVGGGVTASPSMASVISEPLFRNDRDRIIDPVPINVRRDTPLPGNAAAAGANRIAGPSFLGLSDEPRFADESSYLLEDDTERSSWRGYLALAFLLIFGVLILRQWTEMRGIASDFAQRLGIADTVKHVKAKPTVSAADGATTTKGPVDSTAADSANPNSSANMPKELAKAKPPDALAGGKPENDAASKSAASADAKAAKDKDASSDSDKDTSSAAEDTTPSEPATATTKTKQTSGKSNADAPAITADNSQVDLAQRYLQGKGVPQNCSRGVSLLRSAARQANPKARIQMAALYLSGHCVEQNLPQAYSWFAQAQELEPHNSWIERNLNSLWAKMTDEERRRVLR